MWWERQRVLSLRAGPGQLGCRLLGGTEECPPLVVRVAGGGLRGAVAKQLGHVIEACPGVDGQRGEAVPQGVDAGSFYLRPRASVLKDLLRVVDWLPLQASGEHVGMLLLPRFPALLQELPCRGVEDHRPRLT